MKRSRDIATTYAAYGLVLAFMNACGHSSTGAAMSHSNAEGLWQQSQETPAPGAANNPLPDIYTFKYEHELVTVRLTSISKVSWRSPDEFYALKTRWQGDTLQYLAPLGQWTDVATFEHGHFAVSGEGLTREYARITPEQVADFNADILKPRPPHDYARTMK